MGFQSNILYNINTDNEVANILSHFNSQFIFDIVKDNLDNKFRYTTLAMPNIVYSFEQNFKQIQSIYPSSIDEVERVRIDTYKEIIKIICNYYQLHFNEQIEQDYYSTAFYLYRFLVCEFSSNLINFFCNYIIKEKNSIYEALNLNNFKKNKDSSSLYSKKLYKNSKLSVIHANLELVIDNICQYDIPLNVLLSNIYLEDKNISKYIETLIAPIQDLFKTSYVSFIYGELRPIILTNIRLRLQELTVDVSDVLNSKGGEIE